jgi:histone-lysine N-methyltransferase SETD3
MQEEMAKKAQKAAAGLDDSKIDEENEDKGAENEDNEEILEDEDEIEEDEIVIQISLSCLITVEMGKDTSIGRAILGSNIELDAPKHIFLMIFMLVDRKNPNSFFKPYYDILPATLQNMPIFWREDELALLKGSFLLQQIEDRNIAIKNDYEAICSIAPELATVCTLDEFKWARMCVCSRNFGIIVALTLIFLFLLLLVIYT